MLLFGIVFLVFLLQTKDFITAAMSLLNNSYFTYIPIIGWLKVFTVAAVEGITPEFYINALLLVLSFILMIYYIYKLEADYYEDVLAATEKKEQALKAKRERRGNMPLANTKLKKVEYKYKGVGAKAIFYRHL